ncbi:MAG: VWA domain-containing protein, partial [Flavobacteriales bacterium]|nr:VWA domain-containing protein [Flavobacteriales bacterium]
ARFNTPFIKVFEEERELTVMLIIDVSGSKNFGTQKQMKQELVTELSAVLAFSAIQNNDKIGVIFFSDKVEKFIPPKKGKSHILRIIRELIAFEPENKGTDIGEALRYFNNVIKKRAVCFVISDFMGNNFEAPLKIANKKHDVVTISINDKREEELPDIGLIQMKDAETGEVKWIDTGNKSIRQNYKKNYLRNKEEVNQLFKNSGVDSIQLRTDMDYIKPLIQFFKRRVK